MHNTMHHAVSLHRGRENRNSRFGYDYTGKRFLLHAMQFHRRKAL
jgi:hypothetical protein